MDEETPNEEQPESTAEEWDIRDLLGAVNLRDFTRMAWSELVQIATTFNRRLNAVTNLPFGPPVFLISLIVLAVRMTLLALVIFFFGGAILIVSVGRSISRISRTGPDDV